MLFVFGVFFRYFLAVFHANVSPLCSGILEVSELLLEPNVMVNLKSSVYIFLRSLESSLIFRKLIFLPREQILLLASR